MQSNYLQNLQEDADRRFVAAAHKAINEGVKWETFVERNPEFSLVDHAGRRLHFDEMERRSRNFKPEEWNVMDEVRIMHNKRLQERQRENDEEFYRSIREDLENCARDRAGWDETRRRLGLTGDMEPFFRRAQQSVGVHRAGERPDPVAGAFLTGFNAD